METFSYIKLFLFFIFLISSSTAFNEKEFQQTINKKADFIINNVNRKNIRGFLRHLTLRPHLGGTPAEWENAEWLAETWKNQGLDEVHMTPYEVLLSYPDKEKPNYARIHNEKGSEIWKSQGRSIPLKAKEEFSKDVPPDFNAYSRPGKIIADIVFINYARDEDFDELVKLGVKVEGCIVIAKYGQMFRGNIASNAEKRGAIGLLLYSDPADAAKEGMSNVYPNSIYLPGGGAPMGTVYLNDGDPITPYYPSLPGVFRIPEEEAAIPKIPVIPLGYNDAEQILSKMAGAKAPEEWQGGLNITYKLGPGLETKGWQVSLEANTYTKKTTTYNVIGVIKGQIEPDRYVVLGNHRDAWIFGGIDPSSGTASMLELSRVLQDYRNKTGWIPRRSIVFCSWGSEEYGLIGSTEWTEHFAKQLSDRAVAYINVDSSMDGNFTFRPQSSPILHEVIKEISKLVPNPDDEERKEGRATVFDTWLARNPNPKNSQQPYFLQLGSGSDSKSFQHNLGIPCADFLYSYSEELGSEPLYHTLYETLDLVELYDKNFDFQASITQMWGIIATVFADSMIIPYSLSDYVAFIKENQNNFLNSYEKILENKNISMEHFVSAYKNFNESVNNFKIELSKMDLSDPIVARRTNDHMMLVERAFIDHRGLPGRPFFNHVIQAPSVKNIYSGSAFPGLWDTLEGIQEVSEEEQSTRWRTFKQHLGAVTFFIETAAKVLSEDLW